MTFWVCVLFSVAFSCGIWSFLIEPNWFRLRRHTLAVNKRLGSPALSCLHLSDLHFTRHRFFLDRFFDRLSSLDIDFVFVTGDLIDSREGIAPCVANLRKLKPKKGTYVVFGNHDYLIYPAFNDIVSLMGRRNLTKSRPETEELFQALKGAGFQVLRNESRLVKLGEDQDAAIIGVDDPISGRADMKQAFEGIQNGALRLGLVHAPILFWSFRRFKVDVAFAGHTHGGQIRLPGLGPLPWIHKLTPLIETTHRRYGFPCFVSQGMGAQVPLHLRFFCRPEALLVRIEGS